MGLVYETLFSILIYCCGNHLSNRDLSCRLVVFLSFRLPNLASATSLKHNDFRWGTGLLFDSLQAVYIMFIGKKPGR